MNNFIKERNEAFNDAVLKDALEALKSGFLDIADLEPYMQIICNALEKQIPKKLKNEILQTNIQGYLNMDKCYVCPLCGIFRGNADYQPEKIIKYQFCPNCGQALDWSDKADVPGIYIRIEKLEKV